METMNENYVRGIAEANDFLASGKTFWKEEDNYFISLIEHENKVYIEIKTGIGSETMPPVIGEETATISENEKITDCIINKDSIILSFEFDSLTSEEVEDQIRFILKILIGNSVPGITNCQLCNTSLDESETVLIKVNNRHMRVHETCHEKLENDIKKHNASNEGNYITGIVGAILFGAIGTIPWVLISIAGWYASLLGMVIALCSNFGYNLFKGKKGRVKSATLVIVLVAMVISAGFVTQLYELFKYLGEEGITDVTIIDGLRFVIAILKEDSEFAQSFITNSLMGIGFGLLGSWKIIKGSTIEGAKKEIKVEVVSTN